MAENGGGRGGAGARARGSAGIAYQKSESCA